MHRFSDKMLVSAARAGSGLAALFGRLAWGAALRLGGVLRGDLLIALVLALGLSLSAAGFLATRYHYLTAARQDFQGPATMLEAAGVSVHRLPRGADGRVEPGAMLQALGAQGLTRVLVEGGGTLAAALLAAGLVDRLAVFRAGVVIGGDGIPAVAACGIERLADAHRFSRLSLGETGEDVLETWARHA